MDLAEWSKYPQRERECVCIHLLKCIVGFGKLISKETPTARRIGEQEGGKENFRDMCGPTLAVYLAFITAIWILVE